MSNSLWMTISLGLMCETGFWITILWSHKIDIAGHNSQQIELWFFVLITIFWYVKHCSYIFYAIIMFVSCIMEKVVQVFDWVCLSSYGCFLCHFVMISLSRYSYFQSFFNQSVKEKKQTVLPLSIFHILFYSCLYCEEIGLGKWCSWWRDWQTGASGEHLEAEK